MGSVCVCVLGGGGGVEGGGWAELLQTPLEVGGAHVAALQRAVDVLLKEPPVRLQHLRRLLVQGVLGVRLLGGRREGGRGQHASHMTCSHHKEEAHLLGRGTAGRR